MGRKDHDMPIIAPTARQARWISLRIRAEQKGVLGALLDAATGKIPATQVYRQGDHPNNPGRGISSAPSRGRQRQ